MKSSFLLIPLLCCFSVAANAQIPHFGAKIGLNFANVSGTEADELQGHGTRTGLVLGAFMEYDFIPVLGIQPEVLYSQKGTSGTMEGASYTMAVNYIEIPVLLKVNMPLAPGTPVKVDLYAGPDFAFNVAATTEASMGGNTSTQDMSDVTNSFDFNLAFGGGLGFNVGPTTLGFDLRYSLGTGTVDKSGGEVKNGVFALMASVEF